jgi:outer membrane protein OmpA-like peptidoglycan-associated protein
MMMDRRHRAVLAVSVVAVLATACGLKHSDFGPSGGSRSLVVLLPDADGSVGQAAVSNKSGAVKLAAERDSTQATVKRAPARVTTLSEQEVHQVFGEALSALPAPPKHYVLYFRFESDELTEESRALVADIQKEVKERRLPDIVVVGHTDTMGTRRKNFELGLKRATSVRNLLTQSGLDAAAIDVTSLGEADLLIKTPDETPEPRNRRVEIAVR